MSETMVVAKKKKKDYNRMGYLFVAPFVIVFLIFSVYPVLRTLQFSFHKYPGYGEMEFLGLDNYIRVFKDKFFWRSLGNTLKIWVPNIILQLGLAFLLTIVFSDIKYKMKGLSVFRAIYYLPNIIAATSIAFLFKTLLDQYSGTINLILKDLGIVEGKPINWLGETYLAPYVVSVISAWIWFGNSFIMLMAGVQGINKDYFEAAAIDGAGRWTRFFKITLPLLKPIMLYVSITSFIGGLQMFDLPFLMYSYKGDPLYSTRTMIMYLYNFGFIPGMKQVGYASAIAYVVFLLILIVSLVQFKLMNSKEDK